LPSPVWDWQEPFAADPVTIEDDDSSIIHESRSMNQFPSRREMLFSSAAGLAAAALPAFGSDLPTTGEKDARFEPIDVMMAGFLEKNAVPGAAVAVSHSGKLVYQRGFGYADVEKKDAVKPGDLFRIASVSKPITAVAVMRLAEGGKLKLEDSIVDLMDLKPSLTKESKADPRWAKITVRQCLRHTGGWDRDKSYDPIGKAAVIAKALDIPFPVGSDDVVRYMMGQPLDFDPGERCAYSNLGYLILGRIIEKLTGQKYETYIQKVILAPLGIKTAQLGRALLDHRVPGEVKYYDGKKRTGPSVYPPDAGKDVPIQYGAQNLEGYGAHGGWIASAPDLVKFASAFDNPEKCPLLNAKSIAEMWARPEGLPGHDKDGKPKPFYYGCGWFVRPTGETGALNAWHGGFIAASEASMVRRNDGICWSVLFNTSSTPAGKSLSGAFEPAMTEAVNAVKSWS